MCSCFYYGFLKDEIETAELSQHGPDFPDKKFKRIFLNENFWIYIEISLKFISKGPIKKDNGLTLTRRQAIILTNGGLVYWSIYASLNDLKPIPAFVYGISLPMYHLRTDM